MPITQVRSFMRGGRLVNHYTAWRSSKSLGGARNIQGRNGGKTMRENFGIVSTSVGNGRGGFTQKSYVATKSSLGRFNRIFNRASGGGGKGVRNTRFALRSAGGRQG